MPPKNWIKRAIKRPGKLRALAEKENAIGSDGKISLKWLHKQSHSSNLETKRMADLALTLRKLRKKRSYSN